MDFKALVEELKSFYDVTSLEAVAEKMGYSKNNAAAWRRNKALSAHALVKYQQDKNTQEPLESNSINIEELKEAKNLLGVSTDKELADILGVSAKAVNSYRTRGIPSKLKLLIQERTKAGHSMQDVDLPYIALELSKIPNKTPEQAVSHYKTILELLQR